MTTAPPTDMSPLHKALLAIRQLRERISHLEQAGTEPIAIVGMGCRMPGADDPDGFWDLLRDGRDMITEIPPDRWDRDAHYDPVPGTPGKTYARHGGFLGRIDGFDAAFFGISAREAEAMDPQQRLLLEVAWETLENAGMVPERLAGSATGVFVGVTAADYGMLQVEQGENNHSAPYFNTGTPLNGCAGRLSYVLGLQGPCMAVDTACSSSLSAIHLACASLRAGECDQALAGGVNLILTPKLHITLAAAGMLSPDGRCKTFDASADGYVRGEGCGLVVLKRYRDAVAAGDRVLALIRGSAINQDGASSGFTVPNGIAQQRLIRHALGKAGLDASGIDYVEAHGTGTSLGDVIEVQALGTALGQAPGRTRPLLVGSVKSNIGHLESAAGVAGLIKLVQALRHGLLPPTLHVRQPNPGLDWPALNVMPVRETTPWPRGDRPRRAGLSSFGATGSNAHLIIEEAPATAPATDPVSDRPVHILTLSARTKAALADLAAQYEGVSQQASPPAFADACHSANTGRTGFPHRAALRAATWAEAAVQLAALRDGRPTPGLSAGRDPAATPFRPVFLFSGQGALRAGAGRDLFDSHPTFRASLEHCAGILAPLLERPLLSALYPDDPADGRLLERAIYAQPALFALQYALAALWRSWGVEPAAVLGHSLGEYCAASIAGVFSLEDGLRLVAERGRLMDGLPASGGMAAIFATPDVVRDALDGLTDAVSIAVENAPDNVVISGHADALATALERLTAKGISATPLAVTHAFHSPVMDPVLEGLERFAAALPVQPARLPVALNLTGRLVPDGAVMDARYWRRHCRETVLFDQGLTALLDQGYTSFIEIGAGSVLTQLGRRRKPAATWLPSLPPGGNWSGIAGSLAEAYACGADIDWTGFDAPFARNRVPVPTYAFQRKPYWFAEPRARTGSPTMDSIQAAAPAPARDTRAIQHEAVMERLLSVIARMMRVPPADIDIHVSFLEMGADSLVLVEATRLIDENFGVKLQMRQFFEEVTTIAQLADHLVDRSTFGLPPAPATAAPVPPAPAPAIQAAAMAMPATNSLPAAGASVLEQLILAQTQLMSQHLALLQGAAAPAALPPAPQPLAVMPKPAAPAAAAAPAPKVEDRSSPLRALANPVSLEPTGKNPRQEQHLAALVERYQQRTPRSKALAQACRAGLADSRASVGFRFSTKEILYPITGAEALGSHLRDVDGNLYIDLTMGFGVLLFGNRPPFLNGVIEAEVARGFQLGPRSDLMQEVTSLFLELTGHERAAFTNSGTEAVMTALRLARAATGRAKIAMFEGSYHGHSDGTLARTIQTGGVLRSEPMAPGVPPNAAQDVLVLEYGTDESLEILRRHAHELAAILVEPVQSRRPDFQPVDFLRQVRALTEESGSALIFDEMITGFRVHQGGAQAHFGIQADIATYGKIVGGGLPVGVVAGRRRFLDGIDGGYWSYGDASFPAAPRTYFGGTFCQHPFTMATTLATLRYLKAEGPALQEGLNRRTEALARTLNDWFKQEALPLRVTWFSSMFRLVFQGNLDILYYHLLLRGIYIWEWRNCFLSTAHTDEDVARFIQAIKDSVADMRQGGFLPERPTGGPDGSPPGGRAVPLSAPDASAAAQGLTPGPNGPAVAPMGEAQRQLWVLAQLSADGSRAYNDPAAVSLEGPLDVAALRRSLEQVTDRHEALRTTFDETGDQQIIHPSALADLTLVDLCDMADPQAGLRDRLAALARDRFDLVNGPLFVPILYRLGPQNHVLMLHAHHLCNDGPAMGVVLNEVLACYAAIRTGTSAALPPPVQYRDFLRWQREQERSEAMRRHEAYWQERFAQALPPLELPTDRARPPVKTYAGARYWTDMPVGRVEAVRRLSRARGCTVYMVMLAAWSALLHRLSGQDELVIGCPYAGRGLPGGEALVGYCVHLLPILSRSGPGTPFSAHLDTTRATLLDAFDHQDYPFARLVDRLGHKRDSSRAPLLDVVFNLERDAGRVSVADLAVEFQRLPIAFTGIDLTLTIYLRDDGAAIACDYDTGLFDDITIRRLIGQYETVLDAITADPGQVLDALPLLDAASRRELLHDWNDAPPAAPPVCFPTLWDAAVARHRDRVALVEETSAGDVCLTYAALDRRANRLAHRLRALGVGPDARVGVCLERSASLTLAMLAVLKAGGAFVPLDPAYPPARLALMMQDARIAVLLTREGLLTGLPAPACPVCRLDADEPDLAREPATAPAPVTLPAHLAYVIYTSGSTGRPKGVMITHQGMVNYLQWAVGDYTGQKGDGAPVLGSIGFDATLTSLFVPLLAGVPVVMLEGESEMEALASLRRSPRRFNFVKLTPAHLELLNGMVGGEPPADLTHNLVLGGEALTAPTVNPWLRHGNVRVVNEYGPTETVVGCCTQAATSPGDGIMPIGRPIAGTRLHVLDGDFRPVPPGVAGELYIGGAGLARGYLGRGDLTAGAFVPDPLAGETGSGPGGRLYRTGDRARYLSDGSLTFLGRMDRQIKLHGFRIELGEVEAVLAGLDGVAEAVVMLREDQPGHPQLAAYIRPAASAPQTDTLDRLRRALRERLPAHMVPATLTLVDQMPLTANGKIDRARLPAPVRALAPVVQLPARTGLEKELAALWQEVLGVETVGVHDNFFDLGGDSFLLLQVCTRLDHLMDRDALVMAFFRHPTIASLARWLGEAAAPVPAADTRDRIKDRSIQQRSAARQVAARRRQQQF
ncbi:non-ribosomal peptide synthetase/type I polyketide synthase [Niveispirillum sp.]|uniref:non-ribosomal peptide synthetase/type I polyketide synthase n=1 Tax=Niveispirillum sp. TaxID=1917217 RepID=UPI001B45C93C|nr:non-ribosomal peptide synthetase/type I polyketide synthase [Niveispirillum sp.]MBP7336118.1 amino acid adenylation domain-containing protein [Niveispirillum sp.]